MLLIVSAHTANLAGMLISKADAANAIRHYPGIVIKSVRNSAEGFAAVRAGTCVAYLHENLLWKIESGFKEVNEDCDLNFIGEEILRAEGSFALKADSAINCTDWLNDALLPVMHQMYQEGVFKVLASNFLNSIRENDCPKGIAEEKDSGQLDVQNMLGAFMIHMAVSIVCLLAAWSRVKPHFHDKVSESSDE